jgi:hypothetical protein
MQWSCPGSLTDDLDKTGVFAAGPAPRYVQPLFSA